MLILSLPIRAKAFDEIRDYLRQSNLVFEHILLDPFSEIGRHYATRGLPTTLFINADGTLKHVHVGEIRAKSCTHGSTVCNNPHKSGPPASIQRSSHCRGLIMIFPFHRSICKRHASCPDDGARPVGGLFAKAETLKLSVTQFGTATQAPLTAMTRPIARSSNPLPNPNTDRRATFVANMDAFRGTVSPSNIAILIDPDRVETTQDAGAEWAETLAELRAQYQSFVAIFDDVEAGSALGASAVTQSGPILKKLRTQLAALRRNLTTDPPEFLTRRSALIARLNAIRSEMSNHTFNHTPTNIPDNTPATPLPTRKAAMTGATVPASMRARMPAPCAIRCGGRTGRI